MEYARPSRGSSHELHDCERRDVDSRTKIGGMDGLQIHAPGRRVVVVLVAMFSMLGSQVAACTPPSSDTKVATADTAFSAYSSFSQAGSPMAFFREQAKDPTVRIHAAIATVPDRSPRGSGDPSIWRLPH
jgi:hypothetical protein